MGWNARCCVIRVWILCPCRASWADKCCRVLRFEDLLRALTVERADIREAMVFALDNADCAAEAGASHA